MATNKKITDTLTRSEGSRLDQYWTEEGFRTFYRRFRTGRALPKNMAKVADNQDRINATFHLRGFQFGNWVNTEDRYNYLASTYICLYDLNSALGFKKNNLGIDGRLGLAFGARGASKALAHYEPHSDIINMTRYKRCLTDEKPWYFVNTGGPGTLAHEYGHFLDFYFGRYQEPSASSSIGLAGDHSTARKRRDVRTPLRSQMENVLQTVYWETDKNGHQVASQFIQRMAKVTDNPYWYYRAEIFARVFEQWVAHTLHRKGIYNKFLARTKYMTSVYLNQKELTRVLPEMDKLISMMRAAF